MELNTKQKKEKKEKINDELLIQTVKDFPIIYDKSRADYKRNDQRDDAWKSISVLVKTDA